MGDKELEGRVAELERALKSTEKDLADLQSMLIKLVGRSSAYHNAVISLVTTHLAPVALAQHLEVILLASVAQADDVPNDDFLNSFESAREKLNQALKYSKDQI